MNLHRIIIGDVLAGLATLPDESVHCCITSPPYWGLRDYGMEGQIGLESTPAQYLKRMVAVFAEVRRVLRKDGTCWVNMGDSYNANIGSGFNANARIGQQNTVRPKPLPVKNLIGMPWRLAFALQKDGWYLRSDIIWAKPNPMPESVMDRPTKAHEYLFLLSKSKRYYYDAEAIAEASIDPESLNGRRASGYSSAFVDTGGDLARSRAGFANIEPGKTYPSRHRRTVWEIPTQSFPGAHFATYPEALVEPCIKAGTSEKGVCPTCAAPWRRLVARERAPTRNTASAASKVYIPDPALKQDALGDPRMVGFNTRWRDSQEIGRRDPERHCTETRTTGWEPSCTHGGDPVPATVLDPFLGSGTTLAVACPLGRAGIGIELNPNYAQMAERRIGAAMAPNSYRDMTKVDPAPLFAPFVERGAA